MRRKLPSYLVYSFLFFILSIPLFAQTADSMDRPALPVVAAEHSVLLDVVKAGNRLVAVGERGVVVLSEDGGRTWRQASSVPVSVTLTKVMFVTPQVGWTVGHSGIVLHTSDGGETWTRQLDGRAAAKIVVDAAQVIADHAGANNAAAQHALSLAQRLVSDGPDKPFLDLNFINEKTGYIVGAYGLIFRTDDGGATWKSWMDRVDDPRGMHIYSIAVQGSAIYLAGEQGLFLRSSDGGEKFTRVTTPYVGTFFNTAILPSGEVILAGMRGNAFRSSDQGKSFTKIDVPAPVSFSALVVMANGTAIFSNQAGMLLSCSNQCATMQMLPSTGLPPIGGLADLGNGTLMTVGYGGAVPVSLGALNATAKNGGAQ